MTLRSGERRVVEFEKRGNVGVAMCDEVEAEHLLGQIGEPEFFKAGAIEVEVASTDGEPQVEPVTGGSGDQEPKTKTDTKQDDEGLSIEVYDSLTNANQLKARLKDCDDMELIMQLIEHENQGKTRETWLNALDDRYDDLKKEAGGGN